jgi:hypothetical protein
LPNVHVGNNVIIGAGRVVASDIPENSVVGNPAKVICTKQEFIDSHSKELRTGIFFPKEGWTERARFVFVKVLAQVDSLFISHRAVRLSGVRFSRWSTFRFMRKQVDLLSNVHRGMTAHGFS